LANQLTEDVCRAYISDNMNSEQCYGQLNAFRLSYDLMRQE